MMIAAMCRKSGAAQIIISDLSDYRLDLAKKVGADITINSARENLTDTISRLTKGKGIDKSFECVGQETCFLQSIMTLKRNGLATIVGIYEHPEVTFFPSADWLLMKLEFRELRDTVGIFPSLWPQQKKFL